MSSELELLQLAPPLFLVCVPHPKNLLKMRFPGCDIRGKPAAPAYASSSLISRAEPSLAQLEERGLAEEGGAPRALGLGPHISGIHDNRVRL